MKGLIRWLIGSVVSEMIEDAIEDLPVEGVPQKAIKLPSDVKEDDVVEIAGIRGQVQEILDDSALVRMYDGARLEILKDKE